MNSGIGVVVQGRGRGGIGTNMQGMLGLMRLIPRTEYMDNMGWFVELLDKFWRFWNFRTSGMIYRVRLACEEFEPFGTGTIWVKG